MGGLLSILKAIGGGAKRLPRIIGDAMYDQEPIFEPEMIDIRTPPFIPDGSEDEGDQDEFSLLSGEASGPNRTPPSPEEWAGMVGGPVESGRFKKVGMRRTGPSKLARTIGDAIRAGVAGAGTENVAGGGPVDIFRSLQAGQGALRQRDLMAEQSRRQALKEEMDQRVNQSNIERNAAQSDLDRAQAAAVRAKPSITAEQKLMADYLDENTTPERRQIIERYFRVKSGAAAEPKQAAADERLMEEYADLKTPENRRTTIKEALELRYGLKRSANMTETQIIYDAAAGDATAQKALNIIRSLKKGETAVDEREKKRRVSMGYNQYKNDLNNAQRDFEQAKAALDKPGVLPGSRGGANNLQSRMTWDEYNQRLYDLETGLQDKKNNAQGALESNLAEYDVSFTTQRYQHPSTQRRTGPGVATTTKKAKEQETLPPEVAAQIPEGKRVRLMNTATKKVETWQRLNGKLEKVQ